jgi:PKD repeat protein
MRSLARLAGLAALLAAALLLLNGCPPPVGPTPPAANKAPVAEAGPDLQGKVGEALTFDGSGSSDPDGAIASWAWDFGDTKSASGKVTTHSYVARGLYTAKLTVTDDDGATDSDTLQVTITVGDPPIVVINDNDADDAILVNEESIDFDGSDSYDPEGKPITYEWNFGDGTTSTDADPPAWTYSSAGSYTVVLVVTDEDGDSASASVIVRVHQRPVAEAGSGQSVVENTLVTFNASDSQDQDADGSIALYEWDFEDDGTYDTSSSGPGATHTYDTPGTYTVRLRVTDNNGATATDTLTVQVSAAGANMAPVADPGSDQTLLFAAPSVDVDFDGSGSDDPDGSITLFEWDFDYDLVTFTVDATGSSTSHTYGSTGTYTVALRVTDNGTPTLSDIGTIAVRIHKAPVADAGTYAAALVNAVVHFNGSDSYDPDDSAHEDNDGAIVSYSWDFGDGTPLGSGETPDHSYTTTGTKTVTLTVTDNDGAIGTDSTTIKIHQAPVANAGSDKVALVNTVVHFDGSSSYDPDGGAIASYSWNFGDGTPVVVGATPDHSYSSTGVKTVSLTVTDADGATDIDTLSVTVHSPPVADAGPNQNVVSPAGAPVSVDLDGSGSTDDGYITLYEWDFDSNGTYDASGPTVSHAFSVGTHTVTLRVTDEHGATDTDTMQVTVALNALPLVEVGPNKQVEVDVPMTFYNISSDPDGTIASYDWDFGDGTPHGTQSTVTHTYGSVGDYTVTLTVTDNSGGSASDSLSLHVYADSFIFNIVQTGGATIDADNPVYLVMMEVGYEGPPVSWLPVTDPGTPVTLAVSDVGYSIFGEAPPYSPTKHYILFLLHDVGDDFMGMFGTEDYLAMYYPNGDTNYTADPAAFPTMGQNPYENDPDAWIYPGTTYTIEYDGNWLPGAGDISIIVQ